MGVLDHWHPVLASRKLRRRPIPIMLCGQQLVLFRTQSGAAGRWTIVARTAAAG